MFFKKNTAFWLRPWVKTYLMGRRIKNWLDVKFKKDEIALTVQKAYNDFSNAKF